MTLRFSVGRKANSEGGEALLQEHLTRVESLRSVLLALCESDQAAYAGWRAAKARPEDDPEREEALKKATAESSGVPLATMAAAAQVLEAMVKIKEVSNPWLRGDLLCSGDLAMAAIRCGRHNVLANVKPGSPDANEANSLLLHAVALIQDLSARPIE